MTDDDRFDAARASGLFGATLCAPGQLSAEAVRACGVTAAGHFALADIPRDFIDLLKNRANTRMSLHGPADAGGGAFVVVRARSGRCELRLAADARDAAVRAWLRSMAAGLPLQLVVMLAGTPLIGTHIRQLAVEPVGPEEQQPSDFEAHLRLLLSLRELEAFSDVDGVSKVHAAMLRPLCRRLRA